MALVAVEVEAPDPGPVEAVLAGAEADVALCGQAALGAPPAEALTEVVLALRLDAAGQVVQAAVTSRPHAPELADCLRNLARSLVFLVGPGRVRVRLAYAAEAPQGATAKQYRAP